ncbi:hypothetical protein H7X65_03235 [Candidatus Parcubacteria bacterium]|nr:hypothetical protein [Candidatus Parcubacteria bacterium]
MQNNNLQFDEFKIKSRSVLGQSESPAMVRSLVKHGIVKSEKQALGVMYVIIIMCIVLASVVIYYNFYRKPIPLQLISPEEEAAFLQEAEINNKQ